MTGLLIIFVVTYVLIVSEVVDRVAAAVIGASLAIFLQYIPYEEALHKVDLNVMYLLVGMMMVVNILGETGLFEWVAVAIAKKARGNVLIIVIGLLAATAVLSAFLDNVTTVVLIAPITILLAQILEVRAEPILILEAIFSNIGGTATLIGDPPNILIGSQGNLTFIQFIIHLSPIIFVLMILALVIVVVAFGRRFHATPEARQRVLAAQPARAIVDPVNLKRGLVVFFLILLGFCLCHMAHIEPGIVALAGALLMVIVCRVEVHKAFAKVEWNTIFFLIGLFMLVGALEYQGLFETLGHWMLLVTKGNLFLTALAVLWVSAVLSGAMGNIPVVIAFIPLVQSMFPAFGEQLGIDDEETLKVVVAQPLYWSLALGTCLGGNGTLFGAAANIVVAQIAKRNKYEITFFAFFKYGFPIMLFTLALSSAYIYIRYIVFAPMAVM
jgi:Na+/H+ antiporter NhaD/arsenite permease-like protein